MTTTLPPEDALLQHKHQSIEFSPRDKLTLWFQQPLIQQLTWAFCSGAGLALYWFACLFCYSRLTDTAMMEPFFFLKKAVIASYTTKDAPPFFLLSFLVPLITGTALGAAYYVGGMRWLLLGLFVLAGIAGLFF